MKFKIFGVIIKIEIVLIILILTCLLSISCYNFFKYFFLCYLFITFHELSHVFTASIFGIITKKLEFSTAGMSVTFNKYNVNKIKESMIILAGPISNIIFAIIFYKINFVFTINIFLAILNFCPIYPLDGYRLINLYFPKLSKIASNIFLILFLIVSILQVMYFCNLNLLIFFIYLVLIKILKYRN